MTTNRKREGLLIFIFDDYRKPLLLLPADKHPTAPRTSMLRPPQFPPSRALHRVWYHPASAQRAHLPSWSPPSRNFHLSLLSQCHHHGIQLPQTHTTTTTPNKMVYHLRLTTELQDPLSSMVTIFCIHIPKTSLNMRNDLTLLLRTILSALIHCTTGHINSTNCYQFLFLLRFPLCPIIIDLADWKKLHPRILYS